MKCMTLSWLIYTQLPIGSLTRLVIRSPHSAGINQIIEAIFVDHQVTISDKLFRILMSGFRRFFKLSIPR